MRKVNLILMALAASAALWTACTGTGSQPKFSGQSLNHTRAVVVVDGAKFVQQNK